MLCENCGTQIKEGASFCHKCGAEQKQETSAPQETGPETANQVPNETVQPDQTGAVAEKTPIKKNRIILFVAALVVVVGVVVAVLLSGGAPSMDKFANIVLDEGFSITERSNAYDLRDLELGQGAVSLLEAYSYTDDSEILYMSTESRSTAQTAYSIAMAQIKGIVGEGEYSSARYGETSSGGWQIYFYIDYYYNEFYFVAQQGEYVLLCEGDTDDEVALRNVMKGVGINADAVG